MHDDAPGSPVRHLVPLVQPARNHADGAVLEPAGPEAVIVQDADELTGLACRRELLQRLATPVRTGLHRAVIVLDVDAFSMVNQTYGPAAGDVVLQHLGDRLRLVAGPMLVGRWQADEFVAVIDDPEPTRLMDQFARGALDQARLAVDVAGESMFLTFSAGMAIEGLAAGMDLLGAARAALRSAKDTGRDQAVWFTAGMREAVDGGLRQANDLRRGIAGGELRLHYQPILELTKGQVVGVEALVRWERPGVGLIAPGCFIDMAERTGMILPLGAWVTRQACQAAVELAAHAEPGTPPRVVAINFSPRQLADPGVVDMVRSCLRESGCDPRCISVEVTETALAHDMAHTTATLDELQRLGVSIALDDFGTGYSSLLYLKHFPADYIKIDQSFVRGLGLDPADTAIVEATVGLAHTVGKKTVAEGVETAGQLELLRRMGCDFAQGFLFSRPVSMEDLLLWLSPGSQDAVGLAELFQLAPDLGRILELHDEGHSSDTIAGQLNQAGSRTSRGSRWSGRSIARLIDHAGAAGKRPA